jgi:hypothetical protein
MGAIDVVAEMTRGARLSLTLVRCVPAAGTEVGSEDGRRWFGCNAVPGRRFPARWDGSQTVLNALEGAQCTGGALYHWAAWGDDRCSGCSLYSSSRAGVAVEKHGRSQLLFPHDGSFEHSPKMDPVSLNSDASPVCTCRLSLASQLRKKSFASGLLSRATPDASVPSLGRRYPSTSSPSPLESPIDSSNDKGPLGLTTLYEPPESAQLVVDLVFIHGLGGGSRKTWSLSPDNAHYWPQAWLPDDEDFAGSVTHLATRQTGTGPRHVPARLISRTLDNLL